MAKASIARSIHPALISILTAGALATASPANDSRGNAHVIYLHGRIVQEEQNPRPRSEQFGYYEMNRILEEFRSRGFLVESEIRPRTASVSESANRALARVRQLVASGVPAGRVMVVGASMGGGIALLASARLQSPEARFAVLGVCLSKNVRALVAEEGKAPRGRVLSIRESSDEVTEPCPPWEASGFSRPGLVVREIVLHTGLRHGFLYRPMPEWVNPVAAWAR